MKLWRSVTSDLISRLPVWVAALWWGSLTMIGGLVVPMLFANLPTPALAGAMAGKLFSVQTSLSCTCGLLLLLLKKQINSTPTHAVIARGATFFIVFGVLLALMAEFAVAPHIVARENLRLWHRVGSVMYLLQWLCATVIFWKITELNRHAFSPTIHQV